MISETINIEINNHCGTIQLDYYHSLDAMHMAEKTLSPRVWLTYIDNLNAVVGDYERPKGVQHSESYQKAHAFYKTITEYGKSL
jgi:hypothetical protein